MSSRPSSRRLGHRRAVVAVALVASLGLTACGGDGATDEVDIDTEPIGEENTVPPPPPPPSPSATETTDPEPPPELPEPGPTATGG